MNEIALWVGHSTAFSVLVLNVKHTFAFLSYFSSKMQLYWRFAATFWSRGQHKKAGSKHIDCVNLSTSGYLLHLRHCVADQLSSLPGLEDPRGLNPS